MPKKPKPWLRKNRGWWVTIEGKQYELGPDKDDAFAEYHRLMTQPKKRRQVSAQSFAAVANEFLDFVEKTRDTAIVLASQKLLERASEQPSASGRVAVAGRTSHVRRR